MRPIPPIETPGLSLRRLTTVGSLLLLMALAITSPASAVPAPAVPDKTSKGPEIQFLYPAGQIYEYDKIFPLVVEISNRGPLPKVYQCTWSLEIDVPPQLETVHLEPGDRRRFSLVFPKNEVSRVGSLDFNKVAYSTELQSNPRTSITGLLSPRSEKFDYLRTLALEVDPNVARDPADVSKPQLVPLAALSILDPELVPESWPLLSSLDVIIAYDLSSMALSKLQKSALLSWVCQGGRLVLVSDGLPEEFQGTPFEPHLPMRPTAVVTDDGLVQLVGEAAANAETLMSYHGRPLLMRRPLMRGSIFLITAPLKEQGPLTVKEAENLWKQVQPAQADAQYTQYNSNYNNGYSPITANTLQNIPELPRAGAGWVALFLLVYALIVGPLNLGILRRKDKMLWSFVTVPVIALLFAGGAYLLNLTTRSRVPVLRELGILQVKSGDQRGNAESEALFFSPRAGTYAIDCQPAGICHASTIRYDETPFGMYNSLPDGGLQANLEMGTWDVLMLGTESLIELPKPLKGSWRNGTLTLDGPFATGPDEAMVYSPEAGQTQPFALKAGSQTYKMTLGGALSYASFDSLGTGSDKEAHPGRQQLLTALGQGGAGSFEPKKFYLLFWTDELLAPIKPQGRALHRSEYLVVLELDT